MTRSYFKVFGVHCVLTFVTTVGCGEPTDRPSEVNTLRVLAVRSETPFTRPGNTSTLSMLAYDGSPRARAADGSERRTTTLWIGGCTNPPGDSYSGCSSYLNTIIGEFGENPVSVETQPTTLPAGTLGWGSSFDVQVPSDIIASRPVAPGVVYPYGVEMVFFAYCGGILKSVEGSKDVFPLGCFDSNTGEPLGRDDFEYGFYPVFSYEAIENRNPTIASIQFDGHDVSSDVPCSDSSECSEGYHCGSTSVCIPTVARCTKTDKGDCDKHLIALSVPHESVEKEIVSHVTASEAPPETLWVSYYATAGSFEQDSRIINDAHAGWNDDNVGKFRANMPTSGEVRIWAVVRDNRNGVAWKGLSVWVE